MNSAQHLDSLETVFDMQEQLMLVLGADPRPAPDLTNDADFLKICLMLEGELSEVMAPLLVSSKPWKRARPVDERVTESRDEIVDVFFFFIELCLRAGISADELMRRYHEKWLRNIERASTAGVDVSNLPLIVTHEQAQPNSTVRVRVWGVDET